MCGLSHDLSLSPADIWKPIPHGSIVVGWTSARQRMVEPLHGSCYPNSAHLGDLVDELIGLTC